jgi:hypothetical protein
MNANLKNEIVKDIFTKEEMEIIYDHINDTPEEQLMLNPKIGHKQFQWGMPKSIEDKVTEIAQKYSDVPLKLTEISAARYSNNYLVPPNLFPHTDHFDQPRFTFDIQLKSTRNWTLYVENKPFTLRDNEAIIFSGTNQFHWREKTKFNNDDIIDMLFCHFSEDSDTPTLNPIGFKAEQLNKEQVLNNLYNQDTLHEYYKS